LVAAAPKITAVSPPTVDTGGSIKITGTGFAASTTGNIVAIGGTRAVVTAATATSLTVTAPPFHAAGRVTVRTDAGTATSAQNVVDPPDPFTAADVGWSGTIAATPVMASITAANKIGVGLLPATAGHRVSVTVSSGTFPDCVTVKLFAPGGLGSGVPEAQACSGQPATLTAPPPASSSTFEVLIIPSSGETGKASVSSPTMPADATVKAAIGGPAVTATTVANQRAAFTVQASSGQRVLVTTTNTSYTSCPTFSVLAPGGLPLASGQCQLTTAVTLPVRGLYRVLVTPSPGDAGTSTVQLTAVAGDMTGTATVDGAAVSETTTSDGQRVAISFSGTAGQRVYTRVTSSFASGCPAVTVRLPDGEPLKSQQATSLTTGCVTDADTLTLPVTGTYKVLTYPTGTDTGTVSTQLFSVPPDITSTAAIDGTARSVSTALGQNALVSFTATAGQRLFVELTGTWTATATNGGCDANVAVLDPNGVSLGTSCLNTSGYLEPYGGLQAAGTYQLSIDPAAGTVGATGFTLLAEPADATAATTVGGTPATVTTTVGQNATVTFPGTAGQHVFLQLANSYGGGCASYQLVAPDSSFLGDAGCVAGSGFIDTQVLPATGTYALTIDPQGAAAGSSTVTVTAVPADVTAPATVDGAAVTVTTSAPGQNAAVSFAGTAGQVVHVSVSANTYTDVADESMYVNGPDGNEYTTLDPSAGTSSQINVAATGTQTIVINPYGPDTGSITFTVASGPPPGSAGVAHAPPAGPYDTRTAPQAAGTSLTGVVRTTAGSALPAATLRLDGRTARTDAAGRFRLTGLPAGTWSLLIDGASASHGSIQYGAFRTIVHLKPGTANALGFTSYLPPLDWRHTVSVRMPLPAPLTLTTPAIPGLRVQLPAGAMVRDADGHPVHELGITRIPLNRTPVPLPPGVKVPVYYTIQPAGGFITGGKARISYPNYQKLPPGARVNLWHYDATDSDRDGWQTYGFGTVDEYGREIVPGPGLGVADFNGAMINIPNQPPDKNPPKPCNCGNNGDPVDLATGLFSFTQTDLTEPGVLPLSVTRGYTAGDTTDRAFGIGGNDIYSGFISSETDEFTPDGTYADLELNQPDGSQIRFARISPGTSFTDAYFLAEHDTSGAQHALAGWNGDGWDVDMPDGTAYVYGDHKPLQAIRDSHGNTIRVLREFPLDSGQGTGNVTGVLSPDGRWLSYTYDASDVHVTSVSDDAGRTVKYGYDSSGRLVSVTDPAGHVTTYGYDTAGRMVTITNALGVTYLTNTYTTGDRVAKQTLAGGGTYTYNWTPAANGTIATATVTGPDGVRHVYTNDASGYLIQEVDGAGTALAQTTTLTRDPQTHLITTTQDNAGHVTDYSYDADGNLLNTTYAAGTSAAVSSAATYDGTPLPGDVATSTDPSGNVTRYTYDAAGDVTSVTDPLGRVTTLTWNPDGTVASSASPGLAATRYAYADGDLITVTDPAGRVLRFGYDTAGRQVTATDGLNNTVTTSYDAVNEVLATRTPLGLVTKVTYDANGDPTSVTDPAGHVTKYSYNAMSLPVKRTDALGAVFTATYDAAGRVTANTNPGGQVTAYSYDALGRPSVTGFGRTGTAGNYAYASTLTYAYDSVGHTISITDSARGAGPLGWTYDALGRVTGETTATGTVSYAYNADGEPVTMTSPGQSTTYAYNAAGQLTSMTAGSATTTIGYDPAGRRAVLTAPGVKTSYAYDAASDLTGVTDTATAGGALLASLTYAYDLTGRRSGAGGTAARTVLPSGWSGATYNAVDQLTKIGSTTYSYNAGGDLTAAGAAHYTWNARGQLASATSGGATTSFTYDPGGRLLSAAAPGSAVAYRYNGATPLASLTAATSTAAATATYEQDLGSPDNARVSRTAGATTASLLTDALGSTVATAAASGTTPATLVSQYGYTPYGAAASSVTSDRNPVRYTGQDSGPGIPAGLQYNGNRFYDPATGRFLSPDPLGFGGGNTNLYSYAADDPVDFSDRSGTDLLGGCLIGAGIGVLATGLDGQKHTLGDFGTSALKGCVVGVVATTVPFLLEEALAFGEAGTAIDAVAGTEAATEGEYVSVYHGSYNNATSIAENGLDASRVPTWVSRDLEAAQDALSPARAELENFTDPGIIESRIPQQEFDQVLGPSERSYQGFNSNLPNSSEVVLRNSEQIELFNKYRCPGIIGGGN
jgi:RHS repeat-associated protein